MWSNKKCLWSLGPDGDKTLAQQTSLVQPLLVISSLHFPVNLSLIDCHKTNVSWLRVLPPRCLLIAAPIIVIVRGCIVKSITQIFFLARQRKEGCLCTHSVNEKALICLDTDKLTFSAKGPGYFQQQGLDRANSSCYPAATHGCKGAGTSHIAGFQHVLGVPGTHACKVFLFVRFALEIFENKYTGVSLTQQRKKCHVCLPVGPKNKDCNYVSSLSGFSGCQACKPTEKCMQK